MTRIQPPNGSREVPVSLWMAAVTLGQPVRTSEHGVETWTHVRLDAGTRFDGEWLHWVAYWSGADVPHCLSWRAPKAPGYEAVP